MNQRWEVKGMVWKPVVKLEFELIKKLKMVLEYLFNEPWTKLSLWVRYSIHIRVDTVALFSRRKNYMKIEMENVELY